jgi:hypothetical protein
MKRYSISTPYGGKFYYHGRTDNPDAEIERYKASRCDFGLQITDSTTKKIIFSEIRPIKGKLILILTDGKSEWKSAREFVDLSLMREQENKIKYDPTYGKDFGFSVVKVDREILR